MAKLDDMAPLPPGAPDPNNPLSHLENSSEVAYRAWNIMITGSPGIGKDVTAATASEQCPPREKLGGPEVNVHKPVTLSDICFATNEAGGIAALETIGVRVANTFDVLNYMTPSASFPQGRTILEARAMLVKIAQKLPTIGVKTLVLSTLSTDDSMLVAYASNMNWNGDNRALYGWVKAKHADFYWDLRRTGLNLIFLCHQQSVQEDTNAKTMSGTQAKNQARGLRSGDLIPRITGASSDMYMAQCEVLSLVIEQTKVSNAGPPVDKRWLTVEDYGNIFTKSRWKNLLDAREPADLSHVLRKVGARK